MCSCCGGLVSFIPVPSPWVLCPYPFTSILINLNMLASKIPEGPISEKWNNYKDKSKLVNPANRKKMNVIVVGTGLAGSSCAASLAEQGYNIKSFCFQDSPRRAHSVAAQGGVNAAKNYKNDGDSACSMIRLKVVILGPGKPMYTV
jgi:cell division GTPase FtsZ